MRKEDVKAGAVVLLPKTRSAANGGKPVLGLIDDPPHVSEDGKRVVVRWGHMSDYMDVFALSDLTLMPLPTKPPYDPENSACPPKMYADITPAGEILQVYSDPDMRGSWAAARYCKDWGVPRDLSYGAAPVDYEIARALGYRDIEVLVQSLHPDVFTLSAVKP